MTRRGGPGDDGVKTAIYDPKRAKSATQQGTASGVHDVELHTPTDIDLARPTAPADAPRTPTPAPPPPQRRSAPLRAISMKDVSGEPRADAPDRAVRKVQIRAMSELSSRSTPPSGMGYLAPPRDPKEVRARRRRDNVIWGSLAVILACGVTLAIWFLAR